MRPIHERVRAHVRLSELTHPQIAKRAGWSEQRLRRLLHDRTHLSAKDMERLARVLRKPVGDLYRLPRRAA